MTDASTLRPGDVRLAHTGSPYAKNDPEYVMRHRPVVLIDRRRDGTWNVAGLTKLVTYKSGEPRIPLPGWEASGLDAQPFLWAPRPMWAAGSDIHSELIGRASFEMVDAIVAILGLSAQHATQMLDA